MIPVVQERGRPWRRLAKVVVTSVVLIVASVLLGFILGPERSWLMANLLYLPYPLLLFPALCALAASLLLGRVWRLAALAAVVVVAFAIMGLAFGTGEKGSTPIRIMTYNVKDYLANKSPGGSLALASEIARHDADVILLQDAARLKDMPEDAKRLFFAERQVYAFGQYVIASRFALRDCRAGSMPFRGLAHSFATCTLRHGNVDVQLLTAHLVTPRHGLNAIRETGFQGVSEWRQNVADRLTQAQALADVVATRRMPMILGGDFNAPPRSMVMDLLSSAGTKDAFALAGLGYGYTYGHSLLGGISFLRIDHILVTPEIAVRRCFTGGTEASPHRPVIADIYLIRA